MSYEQVFENIDRLVEVEMRTQGLPVGIISQLYQIARGDGEPLSLRAATALRERGGERIAMVTGMAGHPLPVGEVDGPVGAAVLARALMQIGRKADLVVPGPMIGVVEEIRLALRASFGIVDEVNARVEDYSAAVAIEKLGRNRKHVIHTIFGARLENQTAIGDEFMEGMLKAGRLTIGLGDGGNEIGFGAIYDEAIKIVPRGSECVCPCKGGMVTGTATEIIFPVSVSNFGAYAITAALGVLEGRPLLLPPGETIAEVIEATVAAGCLDGGNFEPGSLGDDGIPVKGVVSVVNVFRTIATQYFRSTPRHA